MLDLNSLAEGKLELHASRCNLYSDILSPTYQILHTGKVPVEIEPFDKALEVSVDRLRLRQVVTNLLSNAIKYTSEGFIRLSVKEEESYFSITVSDSGVGVKPSEYENLFSRYEKLGSAVNGAGIGLSLCKSLVRAMKGKLYLNKEYNTGIPHRPGAQFVVKLPHQKKYHAAPAAVISKTTETVAQQSSLTEARDLHFTSKTKFRGKFNVLVVDDDKIGQKMLVRRFGNSFPEANVQCALSGEIAVEMAKGTVFDLITMDHYMKVDEMNGTETIQSLRTNGVEATIVGISGNAKHVEHMGAGANDFFQKPVPPNDVLFARLAKALSPPVGWKVLLVHRTAEEIAELERCIRDLSIPHRCTSIPTATEPPEVRLELYPIF